MIVQYESAAAVLAAYKALGCSRKMTYGGNSWYGDESEADTLRLTASGDTRLVGEAETFLNKLDNAIETNRKVWEDSPSGAYVVVPDLLAGRPTPMRRQVFQKDDRAPITILIDTGSSGGITADILKRRGIVALALVMALSRIRPTTLYQLDCGSGTKDGTGEIVLTTRINTAPLDLATACYLLTSAGYARGLVYNLEDKLNGNSGSWPQGFNYADPTKYYERLKVRMGFDPAMTLIIPAARLHDPLLIDPLGWINKQIKHFTTEQEELA